MSDTRMIDLLEDDMKQRRTEVEVLGVTLFVTPLTMAEQMTINAKHPEDAALRFAEMIVMKCRDAKGQPVFSKDDKSRLKRAVAGDRLSRLINAITGPAPEAQLKN